MKSKAVTTMESLLAPAIRSLKKKFLKLPKRNFWEVVHSDLPKEGVYLIFDDQNTLLYVGYSGKNLKSRIRSHVGSADPFMLWLIGELGTVVTKRIHRCTCGVEQNCCSGEIVTEGFREAHEKMMTKMYNTFSVAVLDYSGNHPHVYGRDLETITQWILLPKYGSWYHPKLGHEDISPDSYNHASIDKVIAALEQTRPVHDPEIFGPLPPTRSIKNRLEESGVEE